jgi:hypothetical protein
MSFRFEELILKLKYKKMKFTASRLSEGNKLFPTEIYLEPTGITIKTPGLFSGESKHFDYNLIALVEIDTPLIGFSTIRIFTGGSQFSANGFSKAEVNQMKKAIEAGKTATNASSPAAAGTQKSVADELKKMKELLDAGVINQQEFEKQKAKILNS